MVAALVFVGQEVAAKQWLDAEYVEKPLGDVYRAPHLGPVAAGVVVAVWIACGKLRKTRRACPPIHEVCRRHVVAARRGRLPFPYRDDAIGVGIGQRPLQNLRHDAEGRHGGGHAQGQDGDSGEREPAVLPHLPQAVAQIVDRPQIGDVALSNPECVDKRSECTADHAGIPGSKLAFPFHQPFTPQPRRYEPRSQPDNAMLHVSSRFPPAAAVACRPRPWLGFAS